MNPAERSLLLAVFRWARDSGWIRWKSAGDHGWRDELTSISLTGGGIYVARGRLDSTQCETNGITESVDVLVALGILPPRFSTVYRAGWDAMGCYAMRAHCGAEFRAIRPAVKRELVDEVCRHET